MLGDLNLKKFFIFFIFIIFLFMKVNTKFSYGRCGSIKYDTEKINLEKYLGKWHEIIRLASTPFEKGHCITAEYSLLENGNIKVENTENRFGIINKAIGQAKKTSDMNRFSVSFGDSWWNYIFEGDYRIAFTDFNNYSVVYSCSNFLFMKYELVWVLARNPNDENNNEKIIEFTSYLEKKFGFKKEELFYTKHDQEVCAVKLQEKKEF